MPRSTMTSRSVDDVDESDLSDLFSGQGVEGDQRDREGDDGVWGVGFAADHGAVEGDRQVRCDRGRLHAASGVGEYERAALGDLEQRLSRFSASWRRAPFSGSVAAMSAGVTSPRKLAGGTFEPEDVIGIILAYE